MLRFFFQRGISNIIGSSLLFETYLQKEDKNHDYKLDLTEFTELIRQNVGRDITLGRLSN